MNLPARNADNETEINGHKFRLWLDAYDRPYILKQWKQVGWYSVWANWYAQLPTGARMKAMNAMGWHWCNNSPETLGWHKKDSAA